MHAVYSNVNTREKRFRLGGNLICSTIITVKGNQVLEHNLYLIPVFWSMIFWKRLILFNTYACGIKHLLKIHADNGKLFLLL